MQKLARDGAEGLRVTWVGAGMNAGLIAIKAVGGVWGKSDALIADAVHSLSDFITDAIVLVGVSMGRKAPDRDHHFGHARIETLATLWVGIALLAVGSLLAYQAGLDIYHHKVSVASWSAFSVAIISIVVKEWLYHYTARAGRRIRSQAVVANAWHHRSDALSSVAVAAGILGGIINPSWRILDAYAALLVSFMIFAVGLRTMWNSLKEVADTAPSPEVLKKIEQCIEDIEGINSHHDLKVRSAGGVHLVQFHIIVDGALSVWRGHEISAQVKHCILRDVDDVGEVIIHVDPSPR